LVANGGEEKLKKKMLGWVNTENWWKKEGKAKSYETNGDFGKIENK